MGVLINGVNYSWSNVKLVLFGVTVIGITKIDYKNKQKKENNYGMGDQPISRGYGNKEPEAKITVYLDEWKKIIAQAPNRDPLSIEPFDVQVSFGGGRVPATLDVLQACEFTEDPFSIGQGDTKSMVELPLIVGAIAHRT